MYEIFFLFWKSLNLCQSIYRRIKIELIASWLRVLYKIAILFCSGLRSKVCMQFAATRHRLRLVAAVKTLAIEKVCEFIALILSGNIYDWSGRPVAKVRFVSCEIHAFTSEFSSGFVTIAIISSFSLSLRSTLEPMQSRLLFLDERGRIAHVNPQEDIRPSWNLADNSELARWIRSRKLAIEH